VSMGLGLVALVLAFASSRDAALILVGLGLVSALVLRRLGYLQIEQTAGVLVVRRRNLVRRAALSDVADQLKQAAEVGMVWESVKAIAPALGADCVGLRVEQARNYALPKRRNYAVGFDEAGLDLFRTLHPLRSERPEANVLELGWSGGPGAVDHDTEVAVDMLCDHVRNALSRIEKDGLTRPSANDEISVELVEASERKQAWGKVIGIGR